MRKVSGFFFFSFSRDLISNFPLLDETDFTIPALNDSLKTFFEEDKQIIMLYYSYYFIHLADFGNPGALLLYRK